MRNVEKNVKYKNSGFTLIELLAVIIILGILMIIAIPSVTSYINNSRKSAYVDTAKEIISGARNFVNEGKVEMYDTSTTYYIDYGCVKTENASKSPYGDFTQAYVIVTYDGRGYTYYWTSRDTTGQGVKTIVKADELDEDDITSDIGASEVAANVALGDTTSTTLINSSCVKQNGETPAKYASSTGETSFTLTYNNQEGSGCTSQTGDYKSTWGTLCTPTRTDYTFQGWFTQTNGGGTEVTSSSIVNGHTTVYAKWGQPTAAETILAAAQTAGQVNRIGTTDIYIFKGGTSAQPANYVSFNGETWRIIGIYGDQLKIIRVNSSGVPTAPSGFTLIAFNSTTPNPGYANSSLKTSLNTTYYATLTTTAKNMIDEGAQWNVGPVAYNAIASTAYNEATTSGTVSSTTHTTPLVLNGKKEHGIGLLASYEFLYATGGGDSCLTTAGNSYSSSCGTAANDWLKPSATLWTLSPSSDYANYSFLVYLTGYVNRNNVAGTNAAVPAVFLKSNVKVVSGDGKSTSTAYVLQ